MWEQGPGVCRSSDLSVKYRNPDFQVKYLFFNVAQSFVLIIFEPNKTSLETTQDLRAAVGERTDRTV